LIALGAIAEPATLSPAERLFALQVLADACAATPLVATVLTTEVDRSIAEGRLFVSELGDQLAALMVPVVSGDPRTVRHHLRRFHESTGAEVVLQDLPSATGVTIAVEDLAQALSGLEFVAAVKCECPPTFRRIARLAESGGSYTLMSGFGGSGVVDDVLSGACSIAVGVTVPEDVTAAFHAARRGDLREASAIIGRRAALISFETQPGQNIAVRKEHWRRRGTIEHATVRHPSGAWTPDLDAHSAAHGY
jgi:4-hydroxy-tetrahydrodipicolinate synthase